MRLLTVLKRWFKNIFSGDGNNHREAESANTCPACGNPQIRNGARTNANADRASCEHCGAIIGPPATHSAPQQHEPNG
jgi:predicted RNA-binding Zn-ribbon protein involved in translation (DUF1610 family)